MLNYQRVISMIIISMIISILKKHESCEIPIIGDAETHRNAMASCHEKKRGKEGSKGNPMFDLNAKNSHAIFNGLKD